MATQQSPCKTPSRRALGDLTPRAINSPASQTKNVMSSEPIRARSPLKKVTSHIPNTFADKENLLDSSIVAPQGKKRGIDEVDGAEMVENAKMLAHQRGADAWGEVRLTTEAIQRYTVSFWRELRRLSLRLLMVLPAKQPCRPCRSRISYRAQHTHT
jgi:hypothetical protein